MRSINVFRIVILSKELLSERHFVIWISWPSFSKLRGNDFLNSFWLLQYKLLVLVLLQRSLLWIISAIRVTTAVDKSRWFIMLQYVYYTIIQVFRIILCEVCLNRFALLTKYKFYNKEMTLISSKYVNILCLLSM